MDKFESKILYILLIGILLCSVQAVAAADISDADDVFDLSNDIETVEAESIDDVPIASEDIAEDSEVLEAPDSEETLSEGEGNFTELNRQINNAGNTLTLEKDYTKLSGENRIRIDKTFTLDGQGHTIDGNGISGGMFITANPVIGTSTITFKNIHFINSNGNAIFADNHHINIYNCTFDNCTSTNGGAIYRDNGVFDQIQRLGEIIDCNFTNCSATNGGAVYNYHSTLDIDNCIFTDNKAVTGSAIYNDINTLSFRGLHIYNTEILENQARASSLSLSTDAPWWSNNFHEFDVTFEGRDNLLNGIYAPNGLHIDFTNVTYHSATGESKITDNNPTTSNREAGINITLCITYRDGTPVLNVTEMTDANGLCKFNSTLLIDQLQLEPGEYTAYAIHEEDAYYTEIISRSMDFTCARGYYKTNVSDEEIKGYPEQEGVEVTFDVNRVTGNKDAVENGTVYVIIDGETYTATVENGKVTLKINLPDEKGEYNCTVYYNGTGTNYYWNSTGNLKVTVEKVDTSIPDQEASGKPGKEVEVAFDVSALGEYGEELVVNGGHLSVTIDGKDYTADVNDGKATFKITLPADPGEYDFDVSYNGTNVFNPSEGKLKLTVEKLDVTIEVVTPVIGYVGDTIAVTIKLIDENGDEVTSGTVTYVIDYSDRKNLGADGDGNVANGQAIVDVPLENPGIYSAKVTYTGNDRYNDAEADDLAEILPLNTTTESKDVSGKVGDTVDITADILDQNGNAVKNGTATLTVDGNEYTAEVKDGKATFEGVELTKNTTATIKYEGNDYYNPSETTIDITVEDEPEEDPSDEPADEPTDDSQEDSEEEPAEESADEPAGESQKETASPSNEVAVKDLATGNPIAMLLLVLMALVSTISIRRQK